MGKYCRNDLYNKEQTENKAPSLNCNFCERTVGHPSCSSHSGSPFPVTN